MTVFGKILAAIGHLFTNLMKEAEHVYEQQPLDVQLSLQNGSAVIAVITAMSGQAGSAIRAAIINKFPSIDEVALEKNFFQLLDNLGLSKAKDLDEAFEIFDKYLQSKAQGKIWEWATFSASGILALLFAPAGTKFAVVSQLLEAVYHKIVKPKVQAA
jgi:hypothetical protein